MSGFVIAYDDSRLVHCYYPGMCADETRIQSGESIFKRSRRGVVGLTEHNEFPFFFLLINPHLPYLVYNRFLMSDRKRRRLATPLFLSVSPSPPSSPSPLATSSARPPRPTPSDAPQAGPSTLASPSGHLPRPTTRDASPARSSSPAVPSGHLPRPTTPDASTARSTPRAQSSGHAPRPSVDASSPPPLPPPSQLLDWPTEVRLIESLLPSPVASPGLPELEPPNKRRHVGSSRNGPKSRSERGSSAP